MHRKCKNLSNLNFPHFFGFSLSVKNAENFKLMDKQRPKKYETVKLISVFLTYFVL